MGRRRYYYAIDLFSVVIIAVIGAWSAGNYLNTLKGAELLKDTRNLPIPVLSGAIHYALGRGIGVTHDREDLFPELEAFLSSKINEIPRESYPETKYVPTSGGHYLYMHYYLIAYLGGIFRLFGISVASFKIACIVLHVASMVSLYGIFRLAMGRLLSLIFTAYLATSTPYLLMLPVMRDFSKAPFILGAVFLMVACVKMVPKRGGVFYFAVLLGLMIGVGYGFRQDVFVCLPPALFCLFAAVRGGYGHPWRTRALAGIILVAAFSLAAIPVFKGDKEVGSTITVHTLFQGLMKCAEQNAGFESLSYDFGYLNYDHPVIAQIRGYAKRTHDVYPVYDLTPAYGEVGKRMFRDFLLDFPGDMAARIIAVMDSLFGIPATPLLESNNGADDIARVLPRPLEKSLKHFFAGFGIFLALVALGLLAARSYKSALFLLLFWGYFSAYPSTLFEFRHYFFLAFTPLLFAGLLLNLLYRSGREVLQQYRKGDVKNEIRRQCRAGFRGALFVGSVVIAITGSVAILREYQGLRWDKYFNAYADAELSRINVAEERKGDSVRLLLPEPVVELFEKSPLREHEVSSHYLAIRFKGGDRTVSFQLLNNNSIFARPCHVNLQHGGTYFFPVYDYSFDPAFTFQGIEIKGEDRPYFEGLYCFTNADMLRLWPYVFVPGEPEDFEYYKAARLDRLWAGLTAEVKAGFGWWPKTAVAEYKRLIRANPFHAAYAERALVHAERCGDMDLVFSVWETIGLFMPDERGKAASWMAAKAERALKNKDSAGAVLLYDKALNICPYETMYEIKTGEILEQSGDIAAARIRYQSALAKKSEGFGAAYRLHTLDSAGDWKDNALEFWKQLALADLSSPIPGYFYGLTLENAGNIDGALKAYRGVLEKNPTYGEALFKVGELTMKHSNIEEGAMLLLDLLHRDSAFKVRVVNLLSENSIQLSENEEYDAAAKLYKMLLDVSPENLDFQMQLGQMLTLSGDLPQAQRVFEALLLQHPEASDAARCLDEIYAQEEGAEPLNNLSMETEAGSVMFWKVLADRHSKAVLPHVYLGIAYKRSGQMAKAFESLSRALQMNAGNGEAQYQMGLLDVVQGNVDSGINAVRNAAAANPVLGRHIQRDCIQEARVLAKRGEHASAIRLYELAFEMAPDDLWPKFYLGELHEALGNKESALDNYRAVLFAAPESPNTAQRMDALLRKTGGDVSVMISEWRSIVDRHPDASIPLFYLGLALESAGDLHGAATAVEQAFRANPDLTLARDKLNQMKSRN